MIAGHSATQDPTAGKRCSICTSEREQGGSPAHSRGHELIDAKRAYDAARLARAEEIDQLEDNVYGMPSSDTRINEGL